MKNKKIAARLVIVLFSICLLTAGLAVTVSAYPEWYRSDFTSDDLFHNDPSTPRLIDNAGILSESQFSSLSDQLAQLKSKFGADFVVVTVDSLEGLYIEDYAAEFYDQNGYGVGNNYSGVIMVVSFEPGNRQWWTFGTGDCEKYFTKDNVNTMDDVMEPYMVDGNYYMGISEYFKKVDVLLTNGKFPKSFSEVFRCVMFAGIPALIAGLISLGSASGSMKAVSTAVQANQYLVPERSNIVGNDEFIRTTMTRTYSPPSSSSGRSGGGSSYSGGHHSSGGHSFSGGGRHF